MRNSALNKISDFSVSERVVNIEFLKHYTNLLPRSKLKTPQSKLPVDLHHLNDLREPDRRKLDIHKFLGTDFSMKLTDSPVSS